MLTCDMSASSHLPVDIEPVSPLRHHKRNPTALSEKTMQDSLDTVVGNVNETLAGEKFQLEHQELFNNEGMSRRWCQSHSWGDLGCCSTAAHGEDTTLHNHSTPSQDLIKAPELGVGACAMHVWRPGFHPQHIPQPPKDGIQSNSNYMVLEEQNNARLETWTSSTCCSWRRPISSQHPHGN